MCVIVGATFRTPYLLECTSESSCQGKWTLNVGEDAVTSLPIPSDFEAYLSTVTERYGDRELYLF